MSKPVPHVDRYMTSSPFTVGREQPLIQAHLLMREHGIRHLPVLHGGKLVGMVSDRDLHIIETLRDVDPEKVLIEEAMVSDVYTVAPKAPLDEVVREMAAHKYGSAVVVDHGKVVGVFTTVDAMQAFADLLETRLKH
ncbi:CBS domain protein [Minicystis rosea]|nr:CBS domain protein [Minicystis rosea]